MKRGIIVDDLIEKINFLKNNFPVNSVVMRTSSKTFYKVTDYEDMAKDDLLYVVIKSVDDVQTLKVSYSAFLQEFMNHSYSAKNDEFVVTNTHLQLLANCYVSWNDCEFGAPCIDPKRPFGNSDVAQDYEDITGSPYDDKTYRELETCLQILLDNLNIHIGLYRFDKNQRRWLEA